MSPSPTLYSISPSAQAEQLDVADVWTQSGDSPLAGGYTQIKPFDVGSGSATWLQSQQAASFAAPPRSSPSTQYTR